LLVHALQRRVEKRPGGIDVSADRAESLEVRGHVGGGVHGLDDRPAWRPFSPASFRVVELPAADHPAIAAQRGHEFADARADIRHRNQIANVARKVQQGVERMLGHHRDFVADRLRLKLAAQPQPLASPEKPGHQPFVVDAQASHQFAAVFRPNLDGFVFLRQTEFRCGIHGQPAERGHGGLQRALFGRLLEVGHPVTRDVGHTEARRQPDRPQLERLGHLVDRPHERPEHDGVHAHRGVIQVLVDLVHPRPAVRSPIPDDVRPRIGREVHLP